MFQEQEKSNQHHHSQLEMIQNTLLDSRLNEAIMDVLSENDSINISRNTILNQNQEPIGCEIELRWNYRNDNFKATKIRVYMDEILFGYGVGALMLGKGKVKKRDWENNSEIVGIKLRRAIRFAPVLRYEE